MTKIDRTQIWSSGGGVQSNAIAALIITGGLPKPDLAVIVDTERERSTTWDYMDRFTSPALAEVGVDLVRVSKSDFATKDLYGGKDMDTVLIPAFTTESGEVGKLPTYCSNEWKREVMRRWATKQGVIAATVWMGITIDEKRRVKQPIGKWQNYYPLIEKRMTRGDCIALVKRMGWPEPPRSACWMCPNQRHDEWRWQQQHAPSDHGKAIRFERQIQQRDDCLWLTDTGQPLADADLSTPDDLFAAPNCDSGVCFV